MKSCDSCNVEVTDNFVEFKCPACGKTKITRCMSCRKAGKEYTCEECGFTGP